MGLTKLYKDDKVDNGRRLNGLDKTYNIKQVSIIFNVHYQTVRNWIKTGYMEATKYNGVVQISQKEVDRLKAGDGNVK